MKYENYSEDINKFLLDSEDNIKLMTTVGSLLLGDIKEEEIPHIKEFKCIKEFLEQPLNSPEGVALKKVFAAAVVYANEKGLLPFRLPESAEEVASLVDDGLTRLKVAYQQSIGRIEIEDVADVLVDRAEARAIACVEMAVEVGVPILAEKLETLCLSNTKTALLTPFVRPVLTYVAEPVKKCVCEGIRCVAKVAKSTIHTAIDFVKERISETAKSMGKKLLTIFG